MQRAKLMHHIILSVDWLDGSPTFFHINEEMAGFFAKYY
jgi:hypothetical protein